MFATCAQVLRNLQPGVTLIGRSATRRPKARPTILVEERSRILDQKSAYTTIFGDLCVDLSATCKLLFLDI
jgi:hypothetical protein